MRITLLRVPYDTALRGWRSGAGPEHLSQGVVDALQARGHDVTVEVIEDSPTEAPAEIRSAFELMRRVAAATRAARDAGRFPIVLSGNCNVGAVGLLSGLTPAPRSVFWFDAHGEANTPETTGSGFLDGMGLAIALGWTWQALSASIPGFVPLEASRTVLLGARDLDPEEERLLASSPVTRVAVDQVPGALAELLARPPIPGTTGYIHLDPDVLDPVLAGQANSHPVAKGLSLAQLVAAIRAIRSHVTLGGLTVASYAPEFDRDGRIRRAIPEVIAACVADGA